MNMDFQQMLMVTETAMVRGETLWEVLVDYGLRMVMIILICL